jgi:hypothetical protein
MDATRVHLLEFGLYISAEAIESLGTAPANPPATSTLPFFKVATAENARPTFIGAAVVQGLLPLDDDELVLFIVVTAELVCWTPVLVMVIVVVA